MEAATVTAPAAGLVPGRLSLDRVRSDAALAARYRAGDERAFDRLWLRHHGRVVAVCTGVLASREDAQDVAQDVFVRAASRLRQQEVGEVRAWLCAIARNAAIDLLRSRHPVAPEREDTPAPTTTEGEASARIEVREMLDALRRLPERQRTALVMQAMGGFSYEEIASTLDTHEEAVRGLLARARLALRSDGEASRLECTTIREHLASEVDGRRRSAQVRRHMRACPECRSFKSGMRADARVLRAVLPAGGGGAFWLALAALRVPRYVIAGSLAKAGGAAGGAAGMSEMVAVCMVAACTSGGLPAVEVPIEGPSHASRSAAERPADAVAEQLSAIQGEAKSHGGNGRGLALGHAKEHGGPKEGRGRSNGRSNGRALGRSNRDKALARRGARGREPVARGRREFAGLRGPERARRGLGGREQRHRPAPAPRHDGPAPRHDGPPRAPAGEPQPAQQAPRPASREPRPAGPAPRRPVFEAPVREASPPRPQRTADARPPAG